jgi:cytoskeletal protein CcmA (bactofilin family)
MKFSSRSIIAPIPVELPVSPASVPSGTHSEASLSAPGSDQGAASVISSGVVLKGSLISPSPIFFHGDIDGEVQVPVITIGLTGLVKGSLLCNSATIDGRFDGDLRGKELVLGTQAQLSGTIKCTTISVAKGAVVLGDLNVGDTRE